ncbi:MAG: hypothetical protein IPJ77_16290 [Planctomycetes bacterium]|nr:hypothetical protein [Planctomycetota bacterium]
MSPTEPVDPRVPRASSAQPASGVERPRATGPEARGASAAGNGGALAARKDGAFAPEGRGAFGGFIGPRNLVALVKNAAPFLYDGSHPLAASVPPTEGTRLADHGRHALGWWSILREEARVPSTETPTAADRTEYFALCVAAHFASAATYVPTDVDSKIRHALWFEEDPREELLVRRDLALALADWDLRGVSARIVRVDGAGDVSGHDGERLSVLCGGLLAFHALGAPELAEPLEHAIDAELAREARAFATIERSPGREKELLILAAALTHNAGDVMQAFNAKNAKRVAPEVQHRYADLARERFDRYGGAYGRASALYRELLASEGHRNYPLRELKLLRASHELLLPPGPFLDDWGAKLARWPKWSPAQRAEVVGGLVEGCKRVAGQESYYRALAGFDAAYPGGLAARELATCYPTAVRKLLADSDVRKKLAVRQISFESSYAKRARAVLTRG